MKRKKVVEYLRYGMLNRRIMLFDDSTAYVPDDVPLSETADHIRSQMKDLNEEINRKKQEISKLESVLSENTRCLAIVTRMQEEEYREPGPS